MMSHDPAIGVSLDQIFSGACRTGPDDATVTGCSTDWRRVQPGDAFVAVLNEKNDGHDDVAQAVERGAAAVIVERPVPVFSVPVYHVDDTRDAWGELCHALVGHPAQRMRVVGVVGTQGKSATIALLESIYVAAGYDVGVLSTLKSYDGMTCAAGVGDELTPSLLASRLARMEASGCDFAFVEVSSQALAQRSLAGVELDATVVAAIDSARLDLHRTTKNYRDAQRRVLDYLSPAGVAILNADDPVNCRWISEIDGPALVYGFADTAQIVVDVVEQNACETVFVLSAGAESAAVRTTIVGRHHVSNCAAAAAMALAHGIDLQTIALGIENLKKLPARMERVDCGQDFPVFVDAVRTACGLRAALRTARQLASGRVIGVLSETPAAMPAESHAMLRILDKLADVAIVAAPSEADVALHDDASDREESSKLQMAADRREAIACAVAMARCGDVVVIVGGNGAPTEFSFGASPVSDAELAREVLDAGPRPVLRLVG